HVHIDPGNTRVTPLDLHDYPFSHSLACALGWSILIGTIYFAKRRRAGVALLVGLAVFSHWILDFVTHRPDLPIYPGHSNSVGLGLWNSLAGTVIVEGLLFVVGVVVYTRATLARSRTGTISMWAFVAVLVALYVANLVGPPPPSPKAVMVAGFLGWL